MRVPQMPSAVTVVAVALSARRPRSVAALKGPLNRGQTEAVEKIGLASALAEAASKCYSGPFLFWVQTHGRGA